MMNEISLLVLAIVTLKFFFSIKNNQKLTPTYVHRLSEKEYGSSLHQKKSNTHLVEAFRLLPIFWVKEISNIIKYS